MNFIDISVRAFNGHFTHCAKLKGVKTQILFKTPKLDLTTIRLSGENPGLRLVLVSQFGEKIADMHMRAVKPLTEVDANPVTWKNRGLMENRNDTPLV